MALKVGHELFGPGDPSIGDTAAYGRGLSGGGQLPTWGVGNPISISMAGLQQQAAVFADTWDGIQVDTFMEQQRQNFYRDYMDPDHGIFSTNKEGAAQGLYNQFVDRAKRITTEGEYSKLSERQRQMVNKPLSVLFQDQGLKVSTFENEQLMNYHVNLIQNNISSAADNLAKYGLNDLDAVGGALSTIQSSYQALGKIKGWDEETIARKIKEDFGQGVVNGAASFSLTNPNMAYDILYSYRDMMPSVMFETATKGIVDQFEKDAQEQVFHTLYAEGPEAAKAKILELSKPGQALGWAGNHLDFVTSRESGRRAEAVNESDKDKAGNNGMSFGLFQIRQADGKGSKNITEFASFLTSSGNKDAGKALTEMLALPRESRKARWEQLVKDGVITNDMQSRYVTESMINPGVKMLEGDVQKLVENDTAAINSFASAVVQHGYPAAARMFNESWKNAENDNFKFYGLVYEARQSRGMSASRAQSELKEIRGMLGADGYHHRQELGIGYRRAGILLRQVDQYEKQNVGYAREIRNVHMPNAFARYYQTGDPEAVSDIRTQIVSLGDPKLLMEFSAQEKVALELHPWMMANRDQPFDQQIAGANKIIQGILETDPYAMDNAQVLNKIQKDTAGFYRDLLKAATADPVGQAASVLEQMKFQRAQDGIPLPNEIQPDLTAEQLTGQKPIPYEKQIEQTKEIVAIQNRWFGGQPGFRPRVLSDNVVKTVKGMMADPSVSSEQKMNTLSQIALSRGDYWEFAANELGIDGGAVIAVNSMIASNGINATDARELMAASFTPAEQLGGAAKVNEMKPQAQSNALVNFMQSTAGLFSVGSIQAKWASELETSVAKLYTAGRGDVADRIAAGYDFEINTRSLLYSAAGGSKPSANVYFQLPSTIGYTASEAGSAMSEYINSEAFAKSLPEEFLKTVSYTVPPDYLADGSEYFVPVEAMITPATSTTELRHIGLEGVRHGGVWLSAEDGETAVLFMNGMMAKNPNTGLIISVNLRDIVQAQRSRMAESKAVRERDMWGAPFTVH